MKKAWWIKKENKPVDPFSQRAKFQRFYQSEKWKRLRSYILQRGICTRCESMGITTAGTEVNHIIPLQENYALRLDPDNLELLCKSCHSKVTAEEKKAKKQRDIEGYIDFLLMF